VTLRDIEPGEIAETGRTLFEIDGWSGMEAEFMVSTKDIAAITADTPVKVFANGAFIGGRVTRVNPKAASGSGLCPVTVRLEPDAHVVPGAYLEASFLIRRERGAIAIPSSALFNRGDKRFVYVVDGASGEKIARLAKIEAKDGRNGKVLVASGLKSGDLLITSGNRGLADGAPVSYGMAPADGD
jgi:RND family efflux transporter MFP subunit